MKMYGIPQCGTIQKTRRFLDEHQLSYEFVDYQQNPLSVEQIKQYHEMSQLPINKFFNTSGMLYREMGIKEKVQNMSLMEIYRLLADHPMLIKRPLLIDNKKVIIGFDEKKYVSHFQKR